MKQFLVVRYPKDQGMYTLPENNTLYSDYGHALMVMNKQLVDEGYPEVPRTKGENEVAVEMKSEVIELWVVHREAV